MGGPIQHILIQSQDTAGISPSGPDSVYLSEFTVEGDITTISVETLSSRIYKFYISDDLQIGLFFQLDRYWGFSKLYF